MSSKIILVTLFYFAKVMDDPTLIFVDKHWVNITPIVHCIQTFLKQWSFIWICQGAVKLYIICKHFNCGMVDNKRASHWWKGRKVLDQGNYLVECHLKPSQQRTNHHLQSLSASCLLDNHQSNLMFWHQGDIPHTFEVKAECKFYWTA